MFVWKSILLKPSECWTRVMWLLSSTWHGRQNEKVIRFLGNNNFIKTKDQSIVLVTSDKKTKQKTKTWVLCWLSVMNSKSLVNCLPDPPPPPTHTHTHTHIHFLVVNIKSSQYRIMQRDKGGHAKISFFHADYTQTHTSLILATTNMQFGQEMACVMQTTHVQRWQYPDRVDKHLFSSIGNVHRYFKTP